MKKCVMVTGSAGFIGGYVCDELIRQGYMVLPFDIKDSTGDVRNTYDVVGGMSMVDAVIHLAAILGTQETIDDPLPVAETNLIGSLNVFEAAAARSIPVVYAAVGNKWLREEGTGAYTITKSAVEDFVPMYNLYRGGCISVVRPVNAYGPRQSVPAPYGDGKVRKIMVTFVNQELHHDPIEVYGDGTQISDMVWVGDVAKSFVAAIGRTGTYGIGPSQSHTVYEIARKVNTEVQRQTGEFVQIKMIPMRRGELPGITAVTEPLLVTPEVSLDEGIQRTVEYYRLKERGIDNNALY